MPLTVSTIHDSGRETLQNRFILDCSVSAAWCLQDEASEKADRVLLLFDQRQALVPPLWVVEMANVLLLAERKWRMTPADTARATELVLSLPIEIEPPDLMSLNTCRLLARETGLTAYDGSYLELAQRHGLPLATLDQDLATPARKCGVSLLVD